MPRSSERTTPPATKKPDLDKTVRAAFVEYWSSGVQAFSPSLESAVDYWLRYHVAKAVIAAWNQIKKDTLDEA